MNTWQHTTKILEDSWIKSNWKEIPTGHEVAPEVGCTCMNVDDLWSTLGCGLKISTFYGFIYQNILLKRLDSRIKDEF